ncbi:MAG: fimbrial protein [Tannerellaceae bacterium]
MKHTIYNLLTFVFLSVCFTACIDEDYTKNTSNESLEQSVKIKLSLQSEKPQTKAIDHILSDKDEEAIKSLQLFIFRRDGEQILVKDYYFPQWADNKIIEAYTGRFIYVLVANQPEEWIGVTKYSDIANKLYTITAESDISETTKLTAVFNKELLVPYPPSGSDIVELKDGTESISLTRLCTKVLLNLKIEGTITNNLPLSSKLNIKSVQMKNASSAMYIFDENAPLDEHTTPSIDYPVRLFAAMSKPESKPDSIDDAFYILERKAHDKLELGTFVEIIAEYRDTNSDIPTKLITYRAMFNTKPFENNTYTGLFNVSRNQKYMLNIKITGTNENDIRVDIDELQKGGAFVSSSAMGRGTGANWEDAFKTINEAIAFVTEYNKTHTPLTSIYVKEGVYHEFITIPDGITIAGGFAGSLTGTNIKDQDGSIKPKLYPAANSTELSSIVTFPATLTQPSALRYFIIENGNAPMGGGVSMQSKHAILQACRVSSNQGEQGGGIYLSGGQVWNCIIDNNQASSNGAGIYIPNNAADAHIQNVTIAANKWSGAKQTVAKGALFNIPSSGIYAAAGAAATAHSCILYNNADESNVPSGVNYKFCAFSSNELLTWDQISNANIRIVSSANPPSNQPFVTEVTTPGFKDETSFELSETSPLLSRGYVGKNNPDWNHTDYNGQSAINKKFPNIGATQGPVFRPYLDMYIKKQSFLPSIGSSIAAFIASNIVDNQFSSTDLKWSAQSFIADYYTQMPLVTKVANNTTQKKSLKGDFINSALPLSISIPQAYMSFKISTENTIHNLERNLYLMPTGAENSASHELFTHVPIAYQLDTKIAANERKFNYLLSGEKNWISATEANDVISFHNEKYTLPVNQTDNHTVNKKDLGFWYTFQDSDSETNLAITPFSKDQFIQVPEWILGANATISVLGLTEEHLLDYFGTQALPIWQFDATLLSQTSVDDGKANTAAAINQLLAANNYEWDTTDESSYKSTLSNAFIFCASLDPAVRQKLINKTNITTEDLSWYIPSINELKFITVFENGALRFSTQEEYYISSSFSKSALRRFRPGTYAEWQTNAANMNPGLIRCIRPTSTSAPDNTLYGGVAIVDSLDSYIVRSEGMYSQSILSGLQLSPNENELAAKFQLHPKENTQIYNYNEAQSYCNGLGTDEHGTWRIPTKKEMMLIYLSQNMMKANGKFESLLNAGSYFILQKQTSTEIKVFEFEKGTIEEYFGAFGRVRCVRSIK